MQPSEPAHPDRVSITWQAGGCRLDRALADWRGISRAAVLRLLDQGAVRCNGAVKRRGDKGRLLQAGDQLEIEAGYATHDTPRPDAALMLDVLQRGDGWLVVNKPAGVPVRPHALDELGTVVNAVVAIDPSVVGVGEGGLRSGVVHRLDNDTSGLLLVATAQHAWDRFRAAFAQHRMSKRYIAIVHGVPAEAGTACRDLWITAHRPARVRVAPEGAGGPDARRCSLDWRVLETFGQKASLVEVDLHTGFLHQVRAMMHDLGHGVVGDTVYRDGLTSWPAGRQMLHAKSLAFEEVDAEASLPDDMARLVEELRDNA